MNKLIEKLGILMEGCQADAEHSGSVSREDCHWCRRGDSYKPILIGDVIFKFLDKQSWETIENLINLWARCGNRSLQDILSDVEEDKELCNRDCLLKYSKKDGGTCRTTHKKQLSTEAQKLGEFLEKIFNPE